MLIPWLVTYICTSKERVAWKQAPGRDKIGHRQFLCVPSGRGACSQASKRYEQIEFNWFNYCSFKLNWEEILFTGKSLFLVFLELILNGSKKIFIQMLLNGHPCYSHDSLCHLDDSLLKTIRRCSKLIFKNCKARPLFLVVNEKKKKNRPSIIRLWILQLLFYCSIAMLQFYLKYSTFSIIIYRTLV